MWLMTQYGFYSIVKSDRDDNFKLRARSKEDLQKLIDELPSFRSLQIHADAMADYRYRLFIDQQQLNDLMSMLSESVNYGNFKDHIYSLPAQRDKVPYYWRVWEVMYEFQEECEGQQFIFSREQITGT